MAPFGLKLWENAFQTICNFWFFDAEKTNSDQTSNVRLPLEHSSNLHETSATRVSDDLQLLIFRRREKKISKNFGAKNLEELDFDVRKSLAPRKSTKNDEKPKKKKSEFFSGNFFRRQKIEICKSSETRVAEVSWRSERSSRGKRTFEVRRRLGGTRGA